MDADNAGYGRPPKSTQFQKGRSGNPKGRPKGARGLKSDLATVMGKRVRIREGGEQRQIRSQLAMLLKLLEKALSGDSKATAQLCSMQMKFDAADPPEKEPQIVTERDREIVADFIRRNTPNTAEV